MSPMPFSTNYQPILPLLSNARMSSYRATFKPQTDAELFGIYLWSQHAAGSLYPLIQSLEVTIRNAIDLAARKRFGNYWWDSIPCNKKPSQTKFYKNIKKSKNALKAEWERRERARLQLARKDPIPTQMPTWTHDQIVAATDFSTWQFVLNGDFSGTVDQNGNSFLWPKELGKSFKNYNLLDPKPHLARKHLMDLIEEVRMYRNRMFHHEPIWTKSAGGSGTVSAIDSVRSKINKIALLLEVVDRRKLELLKDAGVLDNARRVCSVQELGIYSTQTAGRNFTKKQRRLLRKVTSKASKTPATVTWQHNGELFAVYKVR